MIYQGLRRLLFLLDAEVAHDLTLKILGVMYFLKIKPWKSITSNSVKVFGITFPNPIGLAAGFDKSGHYIDALQNLGFGFVEVGTVTPKPQKGNSKPRLFRIPKKNAIVNRMGFNNPGIDVVVDNLQKRKLPGIIGINIGKNTDTPLEKAADDYCYCLRKAYPHVNYITINISSPNSPGLRDLQSGDYLQNLLTQLDRVQEEMLVQNYRKIPLLLKIAPDLDDSSLEQLVKVVLEHQIDGIIATNTTLNHADIADLPHGNEVGGVSGEPLFFHSTHILQKVNRLLENRLPIIGVGGILSAMDAQEKFEGGASLIQIYSGLIYQGPKLINDILHEI